jgi:hypothetical protein
MSGVEGQPEAPSQRTKGALLTLSDRLVSTHSGPAFAVRVGLTSRLLREEVLQRVARLFGMRLDDR